MKDKYLYYLLLVIGFSMFLDALTTFIALTFIDRAVESNVCIKQVLDAFGVNFIFLLLLIEIFFIYLILVGANHIAEQIKVIPKKIIDILILSGSLVFSFLIFLVAIDNFKLINKFINMLILIIT